MKKTKRKSKKIVKRTKKYLLDEESELVGTLDEDEKKILDDTIRDTVENLEDRIDHDLLASEGLIKK